MTLDDLRRFKSIHIGAFTLEPDEKPLHWGHLELERGRPNITVHPNLYVDGDCIIRYVGGHPAVWHVGEDSIEEEDIEPSPELLDFLLNLSERSSV